MNRQAAAYWIPAFAGMTTSCGVVTSTSLPATNAKRLRKGAEATKAIHASASGEVDCFASLAMTGMGRIVPDTPVCVGYDDLFATRKILETGSVLGTSPMPVTPM